MEASLKKTLDQISLGQNIAPHCHSGRPTHCHINTHYRSDTHCHSGTQCSTHCRTHFAAHCEDESRSSNINVEQVSQVCRAAP